MLIEAARIILGSVFVLFLPGYVWSFVFFKKDDIDIIERIALSFGLSIAIVPLIVFYLNWLFHIKINLINSSITILLISAIGYYFSKHGISLKSERTANILKPKIKHRTHELAALHNHVSNKKHEFHYKPNKKLSERINDKIKDVMKILKKKH